MNVSPFAKTYGSRRVLDFPAFTFDSGRIYAVIGANGSGKSTLARILSGIEAGDDKARPLSGVSVGFMPQKNFAFRMSTKANILLNGSDENRAVSLMDALSLAPLADKNAQKLSGGETARMALARLLMRRYDLVILDEPTAAMDMEFTAKSEALLRDSCRETGCAVLLVTHSIPQARRLADDLLFLHKGELKEFGRTEKLLSSPETPELRQFLDFCGI